MDQSLNHLPEENKNELNRAVSIIRKMCDDVEIIVLFGSYARGDWREDGDLRPDRKSGDSSDYDILVICGDKSSVANHLLWDNVSQQCNGPDSSIPFRIIIHDITYIKRRLKEIHYFFSDIAKEGRVLYTSGKYEFKVGKELTPSRQLKVAREHFEYWYKKAEEFSIDYHNAFSRKSYSIAALYLHQAAESAYKALLLVYTNYSAYNHFLVSMGRETGEILPEMEAIFPCETEADKELFRLFDYAYIGSRYDPDFDIAKEDLEYLSGRVKLLLERTEELCNAKIESLKRLCEQST